MDTDEQRVVSDVERYGWHVVLIPEDEEGPAFAYSIGLYKSYGQPEIIVFGLPLELMHRIVNGIGELAKRGTPIRDNDSVSDVLEGYNVQFRQVAEKYFREYLGYARWFYKGNNFPVVQCVWPDARQKYPFDDDASQWIKDRQPVLGDSPT